MTARYTPQQNNVVERKNRTVMDMVGPVMHAKNMPKGFWAKAVFCAIYILNRCCTRTILGRPHKKFGLVESIPSMLSTFMMVGGNLIGFLG